MSDEQHRDNTLSRENMKVEKWMRRASAEISKERERLENSHDAAMNAPLNWREQIIARHYAPRDAKVRALCEAAGKLRDNIAIHTDKDGYSYVDCRSEYMAAFDTTLAALEADDA